MLYGLYVNETPSTNKDKDNMARIVGIDIPNEKRVEVGLTYVKGIGVSTSRKLLNLTGIDPNKRVKDLSEEEIANLQGQLVSLGISVEGELRRIVTSNIRRLIVL